MKVVYVERGEIVRVCVCVCAREANNAHTHTRTYTERKTRGHNSRRKGELLRSVGGKEGSPGGLIVFLRINIINVIQQSVLDEGAITLGKIRRHFPNRSAPGPSIGDGSKRARFVLPEILSPIARESRILSIKERFSERNGNFCRCEVR